MRKFKGIILAVVVLALNSLTSSCVLTQKQQTRFLAKHCVGSDSTIINHDVIFKDTTYYITTQGPIQYLENPCKKLCDSLGNLKPFSMVEKKNGIKTTIKSIGNSISINSETDSLAAKAKLKTTTNTTTSKAVKIVKEYCQREHCTGWCGFTNYWFWISSSILAIWTLLKVFKGYITTAVPFLGKFIK